MLKDPFATDRPLIAPSILAADFGRLGREIADVEAGGADLVHCDIMDGHFVPNLSFGPAVVKAARRATQGYLEAHLMIEQPERYAAAFVEAGADGILFHVELADNVNRTLDGLCAAIEGTGANVGVVLNPATTAGAVEPILERVKTVLVMSVVPGFGGQSFMDAVLPKVEAIKRRLRPDQRLEMDGGIDVETIRRCRDAGCDWFVAGTSVFGQPDRATAIAALKAAMDTEPRP